MIWFAFSLLFFQSLYAYIHPSTDARVMEGMLLLCAIESPSDYESFWEDQSFREIRFYQTYITSEIASNLALRFPNRKNLESFSFSKCAWEKSAIEIMVNALVSNPHIKSVSCNWEFFDFFPSFIHAIYQREQPYLKELVVVPDFRFIKDDIEEIEMEDSKAENVFSLLEKVAIYSFRNTNERLIRKMIPAMKNLKSITLKDEKKLQPRLAKLFNSLEKVENLSISFDDDESFDLVLQMTLQMPNLENLELEYLGRENNDFNLSRLADQLVNLKKLQVFKLSGHLNGYELLSSSLKNVPSLQKVTLPVILAQEENFSLYKSELTLFNPQEYPFKTVVLQIETEEKREEETSSPESATKKIAAQSTFLKPKEFLALLPKGIVDLKLNLKKINAESLSLLSQWLLQNNDYLKQMTVYITLTQQEYNDLASPIALFSKSYNVNVSSNSYFDSIWITIEKKNNE